MGRSEKSGRKRDGENGKKEAKESLNTFTVHLNTCNKCTR